MQHLHCLRNCGPFSLLVASQPWCLNIDLIKGHQPAGTKAGVQGQAQGLSQAAKDALARALGMAAAPQA